MITSSNYIENGPEPEKLAAILLRDQVLRRKTPSVQYYFFDQTNVLFSYCYGLADVANKIQVTENTTYNAFSVTKTFTAIAVLQLQEKGFIDIENPVKKYLSGFPYGNDITVKHLLNHSSGLPNPIPLNWIHLIEEHPAFNRDAFFHSVFDRNKNLKFIPNEKFSYSNLGFVILGQLIEEVTGRSFEDYIHENILKRLPISAEDLSFDVTGSGTQAKGYHKKYSLSNLVLRWLIDKRKFIDKTESGWNSFRPLYVNGVSYGGLIGKPKAFVTYLQELLRENSALVSTSSLALLLTENKTNAGKKTGMCLSWFKGKLNNEEYFAHAGGGGGYYCEIRFYPKIKKGSVIFFNRSGIKDERFLDKVDTYLIHAEQLLYKHS